MQALAVYPGTRQIALIEHPAPQLVTNTDVQLRMLCVGVCGTDREICSFEYGTPPAGSDYLILGHESLAEVMSVGGGVTSLKPGDLVVPMVRRPCNVATCEPCRVNRQDFCVTGEYTERGIRGAHGFMTQEVVEDARWLVPLPEVLREVGVLIEPLTIAEKALLEVRAMLDRMPWRGETLDGLHALVLGGGPVGLLGAMALRAAGCSVTLVSRQSSNDVRASLMEQIGGAYISVETESLTQVMQRLPRTDVVYEAVGASAPAFEALQALGPNGLFVFTGVPGRRGTPDLDSGTLMRSLVLGNQVLLGTVNAGRDAFEAAVADLSRFMARWPDAVRALLTEHVPLTDAVRVMTTRGSGIKTVVELA